MQPSTASVTLLADASSAPDRRFAPAALAADRHRWTGERTMSDSGQSIEIRELVAEQAGRPATDVDLSTRLDEDLGLYGDDVNEIVFELADRFGVDITDFRWYHHTEPEGCNPFYLFFRPWWTRATHIPIRVADLVASVDSGRWTIAYPDERVEPRTNVADVLLWTFLGTILVLAAVMLLGRLL